MPGRLSCPGKQCEYRTCASARPLYRQQMGHKVESVRPCLVIVYRPWTEGGTQLRVMLVVSVACGGGDGRGEAAAAGNSTSQSAVDEAHVCLQVARFGTRISLFW